MTAGFNKLFKLFYDVDVKFNSTSLIIILCLSSFGAFAVDIRFPDEELASESVLPLFTPSKTVLNRNISLKHKFEIGGSASFGLDEPFYFSAYTTGQVSFYFTESQGVNLSGTYFFPILSAIGKSLKEGGGLATGQTFNVWGLPYPQAMGFLDYQYTPYYGKISLAKKAILNLSIYGFAGPGMLVFNDGARVFSANIGVGQKLYFNKWLAIRGEIGFYGYYGPSPARTNLNNVDNGAIRYNQLTPENKSVIINLMASVGFVILI